MATIFSKIIAGQIPSYKVAENDKCYAFLDINPLTKGHTLVVPKIETDYLFDLDDDIYSELMLFSKKVATAIEKTVQCKRIAVVVLGLEVPHAHIHLIPMQKESDISFSNKRVELSKEEMTAIAQNIALLL
ncbi:MAG: HIT family protein [Marinilabiliaceae bacterium]|nr:HIT family protein [Marinilabiliaceae bacterium]